MPRTKKGGSIIWSAICRNEVILVEAGEDSHGGGVVELAQTLVNKKATAGWEYERLRKAGLRGIKFHVFDTNSSTQYSTATRSSSMIIWSFLAIADATLDKQIVQSFLEKQVYLTQPLRQDNDQWRLGPTLAAQADYAPILLQKMNQASTDSPMARIHEELNTAKELMEENIHLAMERQEQLEEMTHRADELSLAAKQFQKKAKQVKRFQMVQNAKHGVLLGTVVTAGVAVVVVPPLVAIL